VGRVAGQAEKVLSPVFTASMAKATVDSGLAAYERAKK